MWGGSGGISSLEENQTNTKEKWMSTETFFNGVKELETGSIYAYNKIFELIIGY